MLRGHGADFMRRFVAKILDNARLGDKRIAY
jgi:hypothetical protein